MAVLDLVPIHFTDGPELVDRLEVRLGSALALEVRRRAPWFDPEMAFDLRRGQYSSTLLLQELLDDPEGGAVRVLGVTSVDLCTPVLTYVFGEAQLDGRVAIASTHRLRPERYGLPPDDELLFRRLLTEAVHELGHTYGLLHCLEPGCAMHASTYAEEIDLKTAELCDGCIRLVREAALPRRAAPEQR